MRNFIVLLIIPLLCSTAALSQTKSVVDERDVFNFLIRTKRNAFLAPQVNNFTFHKIQTGLSENQFISRITRNDTLFIDTLKISKEERRTIDSSLSSQFAYRWSIEDMKQSSLSRFDLIDTTKPKTFPEFNYIVYQIAKPIFIRNNTIAFAYYDYACGSLCGHGELIILKKKNDKWQWWWTIFSFDS
ncbi:MAG: hypothetical protein QM802_25635 [Agriterribacter sp.]